MEKPSIMGLKTATYLEEAEVNMENDLIGDKPPYSTAISLRIWHPSVLCDHITGVIGLLPSVSNNVGTPRLTPKGQVLDGSYTQTYWLHKWTLPEGSEIETSLLTALDTLRSKAEFFKKLNSTGGRSELFVGVFLNKNAGVELNTNLVRQLADAGLGLSFDVYVPGL